MSTPDVSSFILSLGVDSCVEGSSDDIEEFRSGWADRSVFKNLNIGLSVGKLQSGFRAVLGGMLGKAAYAASKLWKPLLGICACAALVYAIVFVSDSIQNSPTPEPLPADSLSTREEHYVDIMTENTVIEANAAGDLSTADANGKESNDEIFSRAVNNKDYSVLVSLAKAGYTKAYYPVASYYYSRNDNVNAKMYAQKAVKAGVDSKNAQALLAKIENNAAKRRLQKKNLLKKK